VLPDNHNHYLACGDIDGMVAAATTAGVAELVFTEHVHHIDEARALSSYIETRFAPEGPPRPHAAYLAEVRAAAASAPIAVRCGIELDVAADNTELTAATSAFRDAHGADWDVVIGSVHVIAGDHAIEGDGPTADADAAWSDYLERLVAVAASGAYDVVSHPVRLAQSHPEVPSFLGARLGDLARTAARADVAVEVNGTDLERWPSLVACLVDACGRHATPVSLGSDAHRPAKAGRVRAADTLLRSAGIRRVAAFERRTRRAVDL
jgi:histidinol phosphatase-like PHP family hydrolase